MKPFHILALTTFLATPAFAQHEAVATFIDPDGAVIGSAELSPVETGGVRITGEIIVGGPGEHGFHIHETGDCDSASDFETAGGHFNPEGHEHGLENPEGAHAGDIPNQIANEHGVITLDIEVFDVSLSEGEPGYLFDADGSALVLHADPDDYVTDPDGNAGDRIACAVIEAAPAG